MLLIESHCFAPTTVFAHMMRCDGIIIEQHENYQKRSYRNRICMDSPRGIQTFSIPLSKGKNAQLPITEVTISYEDNWPAQLHKMLQTNYGSSPFYEHYIEDILSIVHQRFSHLYELNMATLYWAVQQLSIELPIEQSEHYDKSPSAESIIDMRGRIRPNQSPSIELPQYSQVHEDTHPPIANLSVIDLLFCTGPEARLWLSEHTMV